MSNMSYCRMQNTYHDLCDVRSALLDPDEDAISPDEHEYFKMLVDVCRDIIQIAEDLGEDMDIDEDEEGDYN